MGMDIYFQAFDVNDLPLGDRQNLRGREIYSLMSRWLEERKRATPSSGERVSFESAEWEKLGPKVRVAIIEGVAELEACLRAGGKRQQRVRREGMAVEELMTHAKAVAEDWMTRIWPQGTSRVEYWFTN